MTIFFERWSVSFRDGTGEIIDEYLKKHPKLWDNRSHFVRCAVEREFRRLRSEGDFASEVRE